MHILYFENNTRLPHSMGSAKYNIDYAEYDSVLSLGIRSMYNKQLTATRHRYFNNNTVKLLLRRPALHTFCKARAVSLEYAQIMHLCSVCDNVPYIYIYYRQRRALEF